MRLLRWPVRSGTASHRPGSGPIRFAFGRAGEVFGRVRRHGRPAAPTWRSKVMAPWEAPGSKSRDTARCQRALRARMSRVTATFGVPPRQTTLAGTHWRAARANAPCIARPTGPGHAEQAANPGDLVVSLLRVDHGTRAIFTANVPIPKCPDFPTGFHPKKAIFAILQKNGGKFRPDTLFPSPWSPSPVPHGNWNLSARSLLEVIGMNRRCITRELRSHLQWPGGNVSGIAYRCSGRMRRTGDRYGPLAL